MNKKRDKNLEEILGLAKQTGMMYLQDRLYDKMIKDNVSSLTNLEIKEVAEKARKDIIKEERRKYEKTQ